MDTIIQQNIEEEEKTYSRNVGITCTLDKESFYVYEQAQLAAL